MKKNKITAVVIAALVAVTALFAVIHVETRQPEADGAVQVLCGERTCELALDELRPIALVRGRIVNGRGEYTEINARGILVSDVLTLADVTAEKRVLVTANDEYSAFVSAAEADRAWLIFREDGLDLVIFDDPDSKRNVRNVIRLTVEE